MSYCAVEMPQSRDEELIIWFNRAGLRARAEEALGRKLSERELDLVVETYNWSDFGEAEHFAEAVSNCVQALLDSGEIKKEV